MTWEPRPDINQRLRMEGIGLDQRAASSRAGGGCHLVDVKDAIRNGISGVVNQIRDLANRAAKAKDFFGYSPSRVILRDRWWPIFRA